MAVDVYQPCPCGSGKKLKFCCLNIAEDMEKVQRLIDNNQLHVALQHLENLERRAPGNPWTATTRATILLNLGEGQQAKAVLREALEKHPEHDFTLILYATAALLHDGYDAAKKAVHRAFQRGARSHPAMVSELAGAASAVMLARGHQMAAREHLALAMKLVPEEQRQEIFVRLLELDNDTGVQYPLRSTHPLPHYSGSEENENQAKKALRYASIGCWDSAADLFAQLAEQEPDNAALWQSVGLCRAWDGNEKAAAEALHRAAEKYTELEPAVECETLAQIFDLERTENSVKMLIREFAVGSVGRLLSLLDDQPRFVRMPLPPEPEEAVEQPEAVYQILDRSRPTLSDAERFTRDTVPNILGQVTIYAAHEHHGHGAKAFLSAFEGGNWTACVGLLMESSGGELTTGEQAPEPIEALPAEYQPMAWRWHFPPGTPIVLRRRLEHEQWLHVVWNVWPNLPLAGLGGKTPTEAAGDPALKVRLTAAVSVLDAYAERNSHQLPMDALLDRLQLQPPRPLEISETTHLNTISAMQMHRVPLERLSDSQLMLVLNRAQLIHHSRFLHDVILQVLARPACKEQVDLARLYQTLAALARDTLRRDEAAKWINEGRQMAQASDKPFENVLKWDLQELMLRLEDPHDPRLQPILQRFYSYYLPKLPDLQPYLQALLMSSGVQPPPDMGMAGAQPVGAAAGGLWTPGQEAAGESKKLWLPGQE